MTAARKPRQKRMKPFRSWVMLRQDGTPASNIAPYATREMLGMMLMNWRIARVLITEVAAKRKGTT